MAVNFRMLGRCLCLIVLCLLLVIPDTACAEAFALYVGPEQEYAEIPGGGYTV